jgi:ligand-binding sensor domain-containing protein
MPHDDLIWIATSAGLRFVNPTSMKVVHHPMQHLLDTFLKKGVNQIWVKNKDEIWLATNRGAWKWEPGFKKLSHFFKKSGGRNTAILSMAGDGKNNVYWAGREGIDVLAPNGTIQSYHRGNGLLIDASSRAYMGGQYQLLGGYRSI